MGSFRDLRVLSDAVSAAQLRFLFAGLSQLICNFFKDLLPSDEGVANDARADIAGYDHLNVAQPLRQKLDASVLLQLIRPR